MKADQRAAMTIGALAAAGGVGVETVRYYQRRGLLPTPARPAGGGVAGAVRRYDGEAVRRLRFIRAGQAAGFTLDQVGELLRLDAGPNAEGDRAHARALAEERIAALDARIAELEAARAILVGLAADCAAGGAGPCPIIAAFAGKG